jgi:hypothetical protein
MIPTKHLASVLITLVACFGVAYASDHLTGVPVYPESRTVAEGSTSFDDLLTRFGDLAKEKGAAYAFDVLRQAELPPGTDIHLLAHEIGHQLYEQQGLNGMALCTQEFGNGCSHSIVIGALQELGDGADTRTLIDEACHKAGDALSAYTMCYHGLGHGVFAFYGYSFPETVKFCMSMGTTEYDNIQAYECIGGAAMELVSGGGHDRDAWISANTKYFTKDPLAPCNSPIIPNAAKPKCYVYMSPHYMELAGANIEVFTDAQLKVGMGYCTVLPYGEDRDACIGGFGKDFVSFANSHDLRKRDAGEYTDSQMREVDRLCKINPDIRDVHVCESYAVSMFFWGGFADPKLAPRFCNMLDDADSRGFCWDYLAASISHMIGTQSERDHRCEQVPPQFRDKCKAEPK